MTGFIGATPWGLPQPIISNSKISLDLKTSLESLIFRNKFTPQKSF